MGFSNGDDGGDTITKYRVEYDTSSLFDSGPDGGAYMAKEHLYLDGGAPFIVSLSEGLEMGTYYYVRVAAFNINGYGAWETSSPAKEKPMQVPTAPTNVNLMITSDTKLTVSFEEPITVGGDDISYYLITWDR